MLDAEDRQTMLEAVGESASVPGGPLLVTPPEYGDPQVMISEADMETINPYCFAAAEDIAALAITPGKAGTLITVITREYRVLSIKPASNGFSAIELGTP